MRRNSKVSVDTAGSGATAAAAVGGGSAIIKLTVLIGAAAAMTAAVADCTGQATAAVSIGAGFTNRLRS